MSFHHTTGTDGIDALPNGEGVYHLSFFSDPEQYNQDVTALFAATADPIDRVLVTVILMAFWPAGKILSLWLTLNWH
jgi:hypothetical protein